MLAKQYISTTGFKKITISLLTVLVLVATVQASAVNLISDNRNVFFANDAGNSTSTPSAPFADFIARPVPVPAMGWLFGLLVIGLTGRRKS